MARNMSFSVAMNLQAEKFKNQAKKVNASVQSIRSSVLAMSAAFAGGALSIGAFTSKATDTIRQLSKAQATLKNVSGNTGEYASNMSYLNGVVKEYNLEMITTMSNYSKFYSATKAAGLSVNELRNVFESVAKASTYFNLSQDETNGIFLALSQIASKGKVQMEELRGQLGERLPIAMSAMANGLKVSTGELEKMISKGLDARKALNALSDGLNMEIGVVDTNTIEGSINKLKNTFTELLNSPDIQNAFKKLINFFSNSMNTVANNVSNIIIGTTSVVVGYITNIITKFIQQIAQEQKQLAIQANQQLTEYRTRLSQMSNTPLFSTNTANDAALSNLRRELIQITNTADSLPDAINRSRAVIDRTNGSLTGLTANQTRYLNQLSLEVEARENNLDRLTTQAGGVNNLTRIQNQHNQAINAGAAGMSRMNAFSNQMRMAFNHVGASLKAMFTANLPMLLVGGLTAIIAKTIEWRKEQKRLNNLVTDTKKAIENTAVTDTVEQSLKKQLQVAKDVNAKLEERKKALDIINSKLGTNATIVNGQLQGEKDINAELDKRIEKIKREAKARAAQSKIEELEKEKIEAKSKLDEYNKNQKSSNRNGVAIVSGLWNDLFNDGVSPLENKIEKIEAAIKALYNDYGAEIAKLDSDYNKGGTTTVTSDKKKEKEKKEKDNNRLSEAQKLYEDTTFSDLQKLDKKYNYELALLEEHGYETVELTKKYLKEREELLFGAANKQLEAFDRINKAFDKRDNTFDYKLSGEERTVVELEYQFEKTNELKDYIKEQIEQGVDGLGDYLNEAIANADSLDKAIKLNKIKTDVNDLKKELFSLSADGINNIATSANRLVEAFSGIKEAGSAWEQFIAGFNAVFSTIDTLTQLITTIQTITEIINKLGLAKKAEQAIDNTVTTQKVTNTGLIATAEATGAAVTATTAGTVIAAKTAEAGASAAADVSKIPFGWVTIPAVLASVIGMFSMLPKFQNGGIIGGSSTTGDNNLVRVNSGEMILNKAQQANLFSMANNGSGGENVRFTISGKELVGVMDNYSKVKGKR